MQTNIIQLLHTTMAYKAAVLQLMTGEAHFVSEQLELRDPVRPAAVSNIWEQSLDLPSRGVGGILLSPKFFFEFHAGRLRVIDKPDWFKALSPPVKNSEE